jgi:hypothetical protein
MVRSAREIPRGDLRFATIVRARNKVVDACSREKATMQISCIRCNSMAGRSLGSRATAATNNDQEQQGDGGVMLLNVLDAAGHSSPMAAS